MEGDEEDCVIVGAFVVAVGTVGYVGEEVSVDLGNFGLSCVGWV